MSRWPLRLEIAWAALGIVLLVLGAIQIRRAIPPMHDVFFEDRGCRMPITVIEPPKNHASGSVVLLHGLSANRRVMLSLGERFAGEGVRAYVPDLPGHGDNEERFSFTRVQLCADVVVESLIRNNTIDPQTTILVGHSMGAAIAIRMADRDPVAATIAISPAPMNGPQRMPSNLLVFSAQFDMRLLKEEAKQLEEAAGGSRIAPEDFAQHRAFELIHVPSATHTSLLFDPSVIAQSGGWIAGTLHATSREMNGEIGREIPADKVQFAILRGLLGLLFLFPLCVTIAGKLAGPVQDEQSRARPSRALLLAEVAACALAGVLIQAIGVPLKFLHLYTGDYLASLLLIVGVLLIALNGKEAKNALPPDARRFLAAAALGFATILVFGGWLNWQLTDMWLNAPRWLRFTGLLPVTFIFCFAEEVTLGPVASGWRRAERFGVFILLRLELWLACALTFYTIASGQVLILLLFIFLALFSILQRLATDALRLRTGSPAAAALFGAILVAWFIAAVFPLT